MKNLFPFSRYSLLWIAGFLQSWLLLADSREDNTWISNIIIAILITEFVATLISWLKEGRWQNVICYGYLIIIISAGSFYANNFREKIFGEDIVLFLGLFIYGYLFLRLGSYLAQKTSFVNTAIFKLQRILTPLYENRVEKIMPILVFSLFFSFGMLGFFFYYNCFPMFSENPSEARYLYFNGPHTSGLTRFFYRIFLAGNEVTAMMLIFYLSNPFRSKINAYKNNSENLLFHFAGMTIVLFSIGVLAINASRGPLFSLVAFFMALKLAKMESFKKMVKSFGVLVLFVSLLFLYSMIRLRYELGGHMDFTLEGLDFQVLGTLTYPFFPEVADGSIAIGAFMGNSEPFLYGRSILSGLLVFIPSSLFPLREMYDMNRYLLEITGIEGLSVGGIRFTLFGESYINFGLPGSIILPLILGFLLGKADLNQGISKTRNTFGYFFLFTFLALFPVFSFSSVYKLYAAIGISLAIIALAKVFDFIKDVALGYSLQNKGVKAG